MVHLWHFEVWVIDTCARVGTEGLRIKLSANVFQFLSRFVVDCLKNGVENA
jgi:hypothetical protein